MSTGRVKAADREKLKELLEEGVQLFEAQKMVGISPRQLRRLQRTNPEMRKLCQERIADIHPGVRSGHWEAFLQIWSGGDSGQEEGVLDMPLAVQMANVRVGTEEYCLRFEDIHAIRESDEMFAKQFKMAELKPLERVRSKYFMNAVSPNVKSAHGDATAQQGLLGMRHEDFRRKDHLSIKHSHHHKHSFSGPEEAMAKLAKVPNPLLNGDVIDAEVVD